MNGFPNSLRNSAPNLYVLSVLLLVLCLSFTVQCHRISKKPEQPILFQPTRTPFLPEDAGRVVPGRVRVVLADTLWKKEFEPERKDRRPRGIERLQLTPELAEVFRCYSLERVWRSMPQLEEPFNGRVRVITYAEWVKKRRKDRKTRTAARPYEPPELLHVQAVFELKFPQNTDMNALLADLRKVPGVISAEAVAEPIPQAPYSPQDPGWVNPLDPLYDYTLARGRWGFRNTGVFLGPDYLADFDIDLPEAWDFQRGSPGLVVAVLDNGVDVTHEDLYLNIFLNNGEVPASVVNTHRGASSADGLPNTLTFYDLNVSAVVTDLANQGWSDTNGNGYIDGEDATVWWEDGTDDDGNSYADDLVGWDFADGTNRPFEIGKGDHGTPVSGLIAAIADNSKGIAGVAHKVRLLPVRSTFNIAEIAYAIGFGEVRVINHSMSWIYDGGTSSDIDAIFKSLEPEGVLYVASLGNRNVFTYGSDPSRREEVASVTNFESDGRRNSTGGSGYGPKTDVASPGSDMYSVGARTATGPGSTSEPFGGTSAASPVTAGVAALIASQDPGLSPEQIRQVLRMTADDPAPVADDRGENTPGWDLYSGWGMNNADSAISALQNNVIYPEANILSLYVNYRNRHRNEDLSIQSGNVPIKAYMGLPAGGTVDWTLRRSRDWDLSGAVVVASQSNVPYSDGTTAFHTINTDTLGSGRHVLELEVVTPQGVAGKDRAVIDLPRAYVANLKQGERIIANLPLEGFAYGPGFVRYRILIAPGWAPAPADFVEVHTSTTEQPPNLPADPGTRLNARTLMPQLDIFALPITLPASEEATIRVMTEGSSTWIFEEKVFIDITQPPQHAGFPVGGFYMAPSVPVIIDLDGDGDRELVLSGSDTQGIIKVLHANGTPVAGWPVYLPYGEYLLQSIAVGDVDGDGRSEIVARTMPTEQEERIRIFNHDGTEVETGWPVTFDNPLGSYRWLPEPNSPALADVTLDGRLDILVAVPKSLPGVPAPMIRAYDGNGTVAHTYAAGANDVTLSQPAIGDIDGDGENEVAAVAHSYSIGAGPATLHVWQRDGALVWSREIRGTANSTAASPVLMDVDDDGLLEIIAAASSGELRVYDGDGALLSSMGTNLALPQPIAAQLRPSIAPEERAAVYAYRVYVSTWDLGTYIGVGDPQSGNALPGWSGGVRFGDGDTDNQPIVADFRGDATLEVAFANSPPPPFYDGPDIEYKLTVADHSGNPVSDGGEWPLYFPSALSSTPLVADLDRDGDLELVVQTEGNDAQVYVYDLSSPVGPGRVAWGEYAHDSRRTGNYHGDLRILSPTTAHSETIGPFNDPSAQGLLLVRTHFTRGTPVSSIDPARWIVSIGNQNAAIREIAQVQGEHWLLVEPVSQPAAGHYTLRVLFNDGGISTWDAYRDAVHYEPALQNHTQIEVIDRSGSMGWHNSIEAARVAARFFAEAAYPDDEVGVVSYNHLAIDELGAGVLNAGAHRTQIADAITALTAFGSTSIGAGIERGIDILNTTATGSNIWGMVLLSDGLENTPPFWIQLQPAVEAVMSSHPEFAIHTVALGPNADQDLLQGIADFTGGIFNPVYLGESLSTVNRLADVFHAAREKIDGTQRILTYGADFQPGGIWEDSFVVSAGSRRLQFGLNWDREYTILQTTTGSVVGNPFKVEIYRPDGSQVRSNDPGVTFVTNRTDAVLTIPAPEPGQWRVRLTNSIRKTVEALLTVSAYIPVRVKVVVGPQYLYKGIPYSTFLAFAADIDEERGFVRKTDFTLSVTRPDRKVEHITLRDDGKSGDGSAGDGIFGARIAMNLPGSYLATVSATGMARTRTFRVTQTVGVYNRIGTDRDSDGIPDEWERKYAPVCAKGLSPRSDPDGDRLDNTLEWRFGTNPFAFDTDGDGLSDLEEYKRGESPRDKVE